MFMTLQTIWGFVHVFVYDTGRDMMAKGIIPAGNMLPEVTFIKLGWVLGQTDDPQKVKEMMLTPSTTRSLHASPITGTWFTRVASRKRRILLGGCISRGEAPPRLYKVLLKTVVFQKIRLNSLSYI